MIKLLTFCVALTAAQANFWIALYQNQSGVAMLQDYVLDVASNIRSPQYGNWLTTSRVNSLVAPHVDNMQRVRQWLNHNRIYTCKYMVDAVYCTNVSPIVIDLLLGVHMMPKLINGHHIYHSSLPYRIPIHLQDVIEFIDGISNPILPKMELKRNLMPKSLSTTWPKPEFGSFAREPFMRLYNVPPGFKGKYTSVGAIEYGTGDGFNIHDLGYAQKANGVPVNPIIPKHIIGPYNVTPDSESQLDVQMDYLIVPQSTQWYYHSLDWMYGWAVGYYTANHKPRIASISWGWAEDAQCSIGKCTNETSQQYVKRCNVEFLKIVATGYTLLAASGDAGSPGRTNEVCQSQYANGHWTNINPIFPSSSPWVLSVGATYIYQPSNVQYHTPACKDEWPCLTGTQEAMTSFNATGWTSGAGYSLWTQTPEWQRYHVQLYQTNNKLPNRKYWNANGRAYPDVSAVGHLCLVYTSGWGLEDGTSCASPVFASVVAYLDDHQVSKGRPHVGFINPLLYLMYDEDPYTFNDITIGDSGATEDQYCGADFGFQASPFWDSTSGLGTPNVQRMIQWLDQFYGNRNP